MGVLAVLVALLGTGTGVRTYAVDPGRSSVTVEVGRAGVFKFAGHEHTVTAAGLSGEIVADSEALGRSSVRLVFSAEAVKVTASEGPAKDIPDIQATMSGARVLDVARFPEIRFASSAVSGAKTGEGEWQITVTGELELRGVRRPLTVPLRIALTETSLVAAGKVQLRQHDYGIEPVSVGGVVKVKDELSVTFRIVARPFP